MKTSRKGSEVFDFTDEDMQPQPTKFKPTYAIDKYAFLQHVSRDIDIHPNEPGTLLSIDIDDEENVESVVPLDAGQHSDAKQMSKLDIVIETGTKVSQELPQYSPAEAEPRIISSETERSSSLAMDLPDDRKLNSDVLESLSNDESTDVVSNADEITHERSPSVSSAAAEDDVHLEGQSPDNYFDGWKMDDANMGIVLYPDYIAYRNIYCTNAMLSFSTSCIAIKGTTACEDQETFAFQWGIGDIIDIQSQFSPRTETVMVKMRVISKDAEHGEDANGSSEIEELKFSVVDSDWHTKQEEITSLNICKPLWNVVPDSDIERNGDASIGENGASCSKRYFPVFDEAFDEVIYPKGDSDAVSISQRDVDLLQPDTFVNDTIIDFYMKYLKNKIALNERQIFHFFNSFFFRKLADLDKDPNSVFDARAAFQRVRKWTRKLNLFEKEFIFIPVNFNYHWSLLVICHPGEVATFKDKDVKILEKIPCILHMDSIRGSHSGLKSLLQSYLWEEWKERHKEASEDVSSRFLDLRFVSLELPQQQNSFDCGLFLLHYAELFLERYPLNFNPFKITKFSKFLTTDWFQPSEASLKRALIQRLIYNLLDKSSPENSPPRIDHRNYEQIPDIPKYNNNNEMPIEFLSERCVGSKSSCDLMMRCENDDDNGIELSLLPTSSSSLKNPQCDSGLASRGFFDSESSVGSLLAFNQSSAFNDFKSATSPIEEEVEVVVEFEAEGGEHSHKRSRMLQESSRFPHAPLDMQTDPCWNPIDENDSISSPQSLKCGSHEGNSQADRDLNLDKHQIGYDENEDSLKSRTDNLSEFCFQENVTSSPTDKDEETVLIEPGMCSPVKK